MKNILTVILVVCLTVCTVVTAASCETRDNTPLPKIEKESCEEKIKITDDNDSHHDCLERMDKECEGKKCPNKECEDKKCQDEKCEDIDLTIIKRNTLEQKLKGKWKCHGYVDIDRKRIEKTGFESIRFNEDKTYKITRRNADGKLEHLSGTWSIKNDEIITDNGQKYVLKEKYVLWSITDQKNGLYKEYEKSKCCR